MIKIALTGTHGVGKTTIARTVARKAQYHGWAVQVVESPTRYLKRLGTQYGLANNKDSDGQLELMNTITHRLRGWEAEAKLRPYEDDRLNTARPTLVIGDRCTLDMVSYMAAIVDRLKARDDDDAERGVRIKTLQDIHDILLLFALNDVGSFWDVLCYKPIHPDHLTADPDRLDDRDYQVAVDRKIVENFHRAEICPGLSTRTLDRDLHVAADEVWKLAREIHNNNRVPLQSVQ